jgi:hypothetical protein
MKPIVRSYLTEINVGTTQPGNGTNINFKDFPQLRDIYITGFAFYNASQVAVSPSGKTVVPANAQPGITTTLVDIYNMEMIYQYPSFDANPINASGFYRDIFPFQLQLTKSYITVLDNTNILQNQSIIVNFFYIPLKEWKKYAPYYVR